MSENAVTQRAFARLRGVSDAMVSRWKTAGRLVLDDAGRVLVAESQEKLALDLDPARGGNRHVNATARGRKERGAAAREQPPAAGSYTDAARGEKLERAAILRLERLELEGKLIRRDQYEAEAFRRARHAQEALVAIPDRLCAQLAAESDSVKVREMLEAEIRHVIAQISAPGVDAEAKAA